jgi:hypothetical protein
MIAVRHVAKTETAVAPRNASAMNAGIVQLPTARSVVLVWTHLDSSRLSPL